MSVLLYETERLDLERFVVSPDPRDHRSAPEAQVVQLRALALHGLDRIAERIDRNDFIMMPRRVDDLDLRHKLPRMILQHLRLHRVRWACEVQQVVSDGDDRAARRVVQPRERLLQRHRVFESPDVSTTADDGPLRSRCQSSLRCSAECRRISARCRRTSPHRLVGTERFCG